MRLVLQWLMLALGVLFAAKTSGSGISYGGDFMTLLIVAMLLSFVNMVLRPLLIVFALPFIVMTLGTGLVLINAFLFWLVGEMVPGFEVHSFWAAIWGAIVLSVTGILSDRLFGKPGEADGQGDGGRPRMRSSFNVRVNRGVGAADSRQGESRKSLKEDDVIDI